MHKRTLTRADRLLLSRAATTNGRRQIRSLSRAVFGPVSSSARESVFHRLDWTSRYFCLLYLGLLVALITPSPPRHTTPKRVSRLHAYRRLRSERDAALPARADDGARATSSLHTSRPFQPSHYAQGAPLTVQEAREALCCIASCM